MCFKHLSSLFLVQKKKLVVNVGEKWNLLSSLVDIENSRQYCTNENINYSLFIKCNFTRMRVFKLVEETFVIHTRICVYFAKQIATTNLYSRHVTFSVYNGRNITSCFYINFSIIPSRYA